MTITAAIAAVMVFYGCGDSAARPAPVVQTGYHRPWSDDDVAKPDWIANPTRNGTVVAAWGSSPHDPLVGRAELRDRALNSARRELARMVMVRVQSVLKDYLAESGGGAVGETVSYTESVSKTIAIESVKSSYQQDEWVHPKTGELFIWAVVNPAYAGKLAQAVAQAASQDPEADAHARAKLESDQGFAELDRLLKATAKP